MLVALALAAAAPAASAPAPTAIDAERAFAADAQKSGQWTAFKAWSTPDALMFTPQPVKAHDFLKARKDPPTAVFWWPGASFMSCDGTAAVNTGPWVREWGKSVGYFTTVWLRQPDRGWKWAYDAGDNLTTARAGGGDIKPRTASCQSKPPAFVPAHAQNPAIKAGDGQSGDGTLRWSWRVGADGERRFRAFLWDGRTMQQVVHDHVAAPPK